MTVTSLPVRDEYTATALQTVFNYTFKIFADGQLNVYITPAGQDADDSTDIITTYTIDVGTIGNSAGGFLTLDSGTAVGNLVTIVSNIPEARTTDYQNSGDFLPDVVDNDFDTVVSLTKQQADRSGRTLAFQESLQNATQLTFPNPSSALYLRWKTDLSGLENVDLANFGAPTLASLVIYDTGGGNVDTALNDIINTKNDFTSDITILVAGSTDATYLARNDDGGARFRTESGILRIESTLADGTIPHDVLRSIRGGGTSIWQNDILSATFNADGLSLTGDLDLTGFISLDTDEITISVGEVTATKSWHTVDTEGDASTDDLDTINGGVKGDILILTSQNGSRDIVLKNATGNILLNGAADYTLLNSNSTISLLYNGANWVETARSSN